MAKKLTVPGPRVKAKNQRTMIGVPAGHVAHGGGYRRRNRRTESSWRFRSFALRGQVERSRFGFNTKQDTFVWSHPSFHGSIASGEPATILSTDLSVKMMIPLKTNRFTPFFIAGGGFATVSYDVTAEQFNSVPAVGRPDRHGENHTED